MVGVVDQSKSNTIKIMKSVFQIDNMENILEQKKEISIFRTSVINKGQIPMLKNTLDTIVGSQFWNFDLEDRDHILRIEANPIVNAFLAQEIRKLGFECEELF